MNHERDPAKHPLLANLWHLEQDARNPSRKAFVVGHEPEITAQSAHRMRTRLGLDEGRYGRPEGVE